MSKLDELLADYERLAFPEEDGVVRKRRLARVADVRKERQALVIAAADAADFIEECYRNALWTSKREADKAVKEHAFLAPLRAAIKQAKSQLPPPVQAG